MRFGLLGPLVVVDNSGRLVELGGLRLRTLLASLLLRANTPIPAGELAEMVWDGSPPSGAVSTLRSYVRRLRRALGEDASRIVARRPGYLFRAEWPELDIREFEALCREARAALRAGRWSDASADATRALGLWRATPLLDVPSEALRGQFVPHLERLRLQVVEDRFDAGLRLGHHQELVPQLLDMTTQHPLQERFHAQLMLALTGTGRRAQALHAYQEARRVLVGELGIEPGPELRGIHRQVLEGGVMDAAERPGASAAGPLVDVSDYPAAKAPAPALAKPAGLTAPRPAQLPPDIVDFTGREAQAAHVCDALACQQATTGPGTVRAVVVVGAAGLGKTTLAVHAAHQVREFFPDGQLYARLSGSSAHPAVPGEVMARFLRDLGMADDKIPVGDEERAALYRTQLADRRMLLLLDDAKDVAQVRPLLPGSASCAVLVTARNRTPNLLSTGFVDLSTLSGPKALELFLRIVGDGRPGAEPEATAEILRACAGLPLAIRICAARLARRPQWRIATMAARLRDERRRLDELQAGDLEVRTSFQVSYDSLSGSPQRIDPARVFRLLGLWPGQRISLPAAAALIGGLEEDVADALEALVDASLLESPEADWYQLHDLLRLFATERAQAEETSQAQLEAVTRLLEWYLQTATAVAEVLSPDRYRILGEEPSPRGLTPGSVRDALAWYDNEQANAIAAIRQAVAAGLHDVAWRLPTALFTLFSRRHNWAHCVTAHRMAVNSARACGSRQGEAWALQNLGHSLAELGEVEAAEAFACLEEALAIRKETQDLVGQAQTAVSTAFTYYKFHGPQAAYDHSLSCLPVLRQAGNLALLGAGLNNHGEFCRLLGKMNEATECLQEALGIWAAIKGGNGHGHVLENLGRIQLESGRLNEAIASLSEAYRLHVTQGHLMGQAETLKYLGQAQGSAGQADQARKSFEAALALFATSKAATEVAGIQSALATLAQPADPMDSPRSIRQGNYPAPTTVGPTQAVKAEPDPT
jgi:DNA-binding SARP family transcriptional activator/tetratricopeptide (TPR) repeat protein